MPIHFFQSRQFPQQITTPLIMVLQVLIGTVVTAKVHLITPETVEREAFGGVGGQAPCTQSFLEAVKYTWSYSQSVLSSMEARMAYMLHKGKPKMEEGD
jgi:hypothetical protein